jgi:hypothetical protein
MRTQNFVLLRCPVPPEIGQTNSRKATSYLNRTDPVSNALVLVTDRSKSARGFDLLRQRAVELQRKLGDFLLYRRRRFARAPKSLFGIHMHLGQELPKLGIFSFEYLSHVLSLGRG